MTVPMASGLLMLYGTGVAHAAQQAAPGPGDASPSLARLLLLAAGPLLLVAAVALLLRRRARLRHLTAPFTLPPAVTEAARRGDEDGIRDCATEEVARLGERARSARGGTAAPAEHALDACAAASTVLKQARGIPDLAGAFALVAEGHAALSRTPGVPAPLPLCFFHPLHGPAVRRIPWRPDNRREQLTVAACTSCIRALRARRSPETLTDLLEDHPVPYHEIPADRSLWSATGYGSFLPDRSLTSLVHEQGL
ncbi:hypothetical protein [Streptomyces sp. MST-110588]|uniref:hypothetical protein n=1 Tax=Streptomyces sp. MST-110588 TaxID=2833628 RepID=UPI001F5C40C7|nr:hypothetical protein [Streptomyces sp. MST-110588]UNO40364.1 hypothetical protein KGS77_13210 [Streptomyces sp. MST-110588]